MSGRRDEVDTQSLDVVKRIVQRMDFQFAPVTGSGVHLADRKTMAQTPLGRLVQAARQCGKLLIGGWKWLGQGSAQSIAEEFQHCLGSLLRRRSQIMSRIRTIETFVAERKIGDNVSLDHRLQQWPLKP